MRFVRRAVAATATVCLLSSCGAAPMRGPGLAGSAVEGARAAERYRVLTTTPVCACDAAYAAGAAQGSAFNFDVVDTGGIDLARLEVLFNGVAYADDAATVVIDGADVVVSARPTRVAPPPPPGPIEIDVVITVDRQTGNFRMVVTVSDTETVISGTTSAFGVLEGECELPDLGRPAG